MGRNLLESVLFILVNLTEYVAMEPRVCVCVYVCVCVCCVCVCDSATAQTDGWILMKFSTNDLTDIFLSTHIVHESQTPKMNLISHTSNCLTE